MAGWDGFGPLRGRRAAILATGGPSARAGARLAGARRGGTLRGRRSLPDLLLRQSSVVQPLQTSREGQGGSGEARAVFMPARASRLTPDYAASISSRLRGLLLGRPRPYCPPTGLGRTRTPPRGDSSPRSLHCRQRSGSLWEQLSYFQEGLQVACLAGLDRSGQQGCQNLCVLFLLRRTDRVADRGIRSWAITIHPLGHSQSPKSGAMYERVPAPPLGQCSCVNVSDLILTWTGVGPWPRHCG